MYSGGVYHGEKLGVMRVPITFLDRYIADNPKTEHRFTINGREVYARILISKIADFI